MMAMPMAMAVQQTEAGCLPTNLNPSNESNGNGPRRSAMGMTMTDGYDHALNGVETLCQ